MSNLIGIHDRSGAGFSPADTWVLDTIALSENPVAPYYDAAHHWICRVNWGYGSTGTIPLPKDDMTFISRLGKYVEKAKNCRRWIIGNETNLSREWPDKQPIFPQRYAEFYLRCREMVRSLREHENDEVLIACPGPWNSELKYPGNANGDWIKYFLDVVYVCGSRIDGFALHSYTHGYVLSKVTAEWTMDYPFQNKCYEFRSYKDYCLAIPDSLAHLPWYMTEANGNGPWQAVGLMPAMAKEIDTWNRNSKGRKFKCLVFYRYPNLDEYNIQGKAEVEREYLETVKLGYQSALSPTKPIEEAINSGKVTAVLLNVRDLPSVEGTRIVGTLAQDTKVNIYEERSGWYRVGSDRWVSAAWIVKDGEEVEDSIPQTGEENWQRCLKFILKWEGGWADDPRDPGGATMKGITLGTYTRWRKYLGQLEPTKDDLRNISDAEVAQIYYEWYYVPSGASQMEWPMCLAQADLAVNGGVERAKQALYAVGENFWEYMIWRRDWYRRLPDFVHFGKGWINRCEDLILTAYR